MAGATLRATHFVLQKTTCLSGAVSELSVRSSITCLNGLCRSSSVPVSPMAVLVCSRSYSFMTKVTSDDLWSSVTSVSAQGRKRGRTKTAQGRRVNLNKGQYIGQGRSGMLFPGLTVPVNAKASNIKITQGKSRVDTEKLIELRQTKKVKRKRNIRLSPLLRGYTGAFMPGTFAGTPKPIGDYKFTGFDSKILMIKKVSNMTNTVGKTYRFSCLVATGNGNGLAGFGVGKSKTMVECVQKALNKAAQRLMFIERFNGHTVYHNFYSKEHNTSVFVKKCAEGSGIISHRVIKDLCKLIGIKDLYVKAEGRTTNTLNLTRAFFGGLVNQETFQSLADRTNLHVVEIRKERKSLPVVLASPQCGNVKPHFQQDDKDWLDLETYYTDGKLLTPRRKIPPVWERLKFRSWKRKKAYEEKRRGQPQAQLLRRRCGLEPSREELQQRR